MDAVEQQIHALEAERARAIAGSDLEALGAMTDEAYVHVDIHGCVRDKAAFLAALSSGTARYVAYDTVDNRVVIHGDVAIVTGRFSNEHVTATGETVVTTGRHVRIYVRSEAGWRNMLHQGTGIAI